MPSEVMPAEADVVAGVGSPITLAGAHAAGAGVVERLVLRARPEFGLIVARGVEIGPARKHEPDRCGDEQEGGDGLLHGWYGLVLLGIVRVFPSGGGPLGNVRIIADSCRRVFRGIRDLADCAVRNPPVDAAVSGAPS